MKYIPLKDHFQEGRLFTRRSIVSAIFLVLLMGVLFARLTYLQILEHEHYTTLSHDNRVKLVPIAPTRGLIIDRNGVVLAENQPSYRLEVIPEQIKDMDALLKQLGELIELREHDLKQFKKQLRYKSKFDNVALKFQLTDEEVARIAALQHRLPGTQIVANLNRHYPLNELFAHVVGYVGRKDEQDLKTLDVTNYINTSHIGKTGIERQYENVLHGQVGYQQVETNAQGRILRVLEQTPPTAGENLQLTIDAPLQAIAKQALGNFNGSVVAIDPRSGEILALVSNPGYDPNLFVNGIGHAEYQALSTSKARPLYNRSLQGRYPPGSTIKPFVGLAGLKHGVTNEHYQIYCPGHYIIPFGEERKFRCWKKTGHDVVDLDDSITQSCDVYFYDLGLHLSIDRIHPFLHAFGFGQQTGIDMPIENDGLLPSRQWKRETRRQPWFPGETLNTSIGQGFLLSTPLQLAAATAVMANRGTPVIPHVVKGAATGLPTPRMDPLLEKVEPRHWDYIIRSMEHVVHASKGTARRIANRQFRIAGKTGTSQVFGIKQEEEYEEEKVAKELRDHALFIAFAPVKEPRIAIAVIVENGGSGGSVAAPIASQVINHYMARNPS